ncbi:NUDIX domain-containing protein [bacterium]|nr:NUDIX domain-containing protein [bacterium]
MGVEAYAREPVVLPELDKQVEARLEWLSVPPGEFPRGCGVINPSLPESDAAFLRAFSPPPLVPESDRKFVHHCEQTHQTVEVVDLDNRVLTDVSRAQIRRQNLLHRAVKIMVVNPRGEVFVHRRTSTKDLFPRMHDMFVGGVVESGESYEEAASWVCGVPVVTMALDCYFAYQDSLETGKPDHS